MVNIDVPAGVGAPPLDTQQLATLDPVHIQIIKISIGLTN